MEPLTPSGPAGNSFTPTILHGLTLLRRARDAAIELKVDPLEFAVGLPVLISAGLSIADVRQILTAGLVEQAQKQKPSAVGRASDLAIKAHSCFMLTLAGEQLLLLPNEHERVSASAARGPLVPRWDRERRQLWFGGQIVKHYRAPADCQEMLLNAFEEEGWPARIDDPLPRVPEIDSKERLHDAVRRLNRSQLVRLLMFQRDGTGEGVMWDELEDDVSRPFVPTPFIRF